MAPTTAGEPNEPREAVSNLHIPKRFEHRLLEGWRAISLLLGLLYPRNSAACSCCSQQSCRTASSHWVRAGFSREAKWDVIIWLYRVSSAFESRFNRLERTYAKYVLSIEIPPKSGKNCSLWMRLSLFLHEVYCNWGLEAWGISACKLKLLLLLIDKGTDAVCRSVGEFRLKGLRKRCLAHFWMGIRGKKMVSTQSRKLQKMTV